ncbi:DNA primase [Oceanobacillus oncorhynchi]|uniref:DNA primase n=1 Tax=Oceanobacillus oncorhynchi TaxID=545501 RepID=UPI0018679E90|nr:toprim domain-containing protein [Oceanobacillus oncorhynchi]
MVYFEKTLEALYWLKRFYHHLLMHTKLGSPAKNYLINRGLTIETIREFQIGYVPAEARPTLIFLKGKGFSYKELEEEKVLYQHGNGKLTTLFRNRIVFPIQDYKNHTVGFGGHVISKNNNQPKYINSAESNVFQRNDLLFGLSLGKQSIQDNGYAILFEGYFDVVSARQAGLKNVVAALGTGLTTNQALLLRNITNNVLIAYDGDNAGMDNSFHAAETLEKAGCKVCITEIPEKLDPDDFLKLYGAQAFKQVIMQANNVPIAFIKYKQKDFDLNDQLQKADYTDDVLKVLLKSLNDDSEALKRISDNLELSVPEIEHEVRRFL